MWVSPKHPDYERLTAPLSPATPPEPTGEVLARFARTNAAGPDHELRVVLDSFEGHDYLSLRVWERDQAGQFWPTRKGVSVRLSEASGVAEALVRVSTGHGSQLRRGDARGKGPERTAAVRAKVGNVAELRRRAAGQDVS